MIDTNDCWLWAKNISTKGYGTIQVYIDGKWRTRNAHRAIYETLVGEIPQGLVIDHLCRVRRCINPKHLEAITNHENVLRGLAFREVSEFCYKGHQFTPENTYLHTNGSRVCKTCRKQSYARYRHKNGGIEL